MCPIKQSDRLMQFSSEAGKDVLVLDSFRGVEGISRLFEFQAELLAEIDATIDPKKMVGSKASIHINLNDKEGCRHFSGIIASFEQGLGDDEFSNYTARIVPPLWQLTLATNCRVYQDKSVVEIVKAIVQGYGITISDQTANQYKSLEYCTQYNETDLDFISRLMEQAGIYYWFDHLESSCTFLIGDSATVAPSCPNSAEVAYAANAAGAEGSYGAWVTDMTSTATMVTGQHSMHDFDFQSYGSPLSKYDKDKSSSPFGNNAYERYSWPAGEPGYVKKTDSKLATNEFGKGFTEAQRIASDARAEVYRAQSNARGFVTGNLFTLSKHPIDGWNQKYLLTEIVHHADQAPSYRSGGGASGGYGNQFSAIVSTVKFSPLRVTPRPRIFGMQTAKVVVESGSEISLDKYGRICVAMWWDREREGKMDNTWVRVAQPWAGKGWGMYFWPRKDDEVVIQFIDGDPDCPLCIGSVYNSDNLPKYALPDMSTRSGIYTRSSKDGSADNANEIRFEDKKGSEQIFINAEMDMDLRVENDSRRYVGGKDSVMVKLDQLHKISGGQHVEIAKDRMEKIGANAHLDVAMNQNEKVGQNLSVDVGMNHAAKAGMNYTMDAGMSMYLKGGMNVVIEGGMTLSLKAGGGFIAIGPEGVAISGPMVLINSGGAATPGEPGQLQSPTAPTAPDEADDGTKGGKK